jgi:hypothetical protein
MSAMSEREIDFDKLARKALDGATYGFMLEKDSVFFLHDSSQANLVSEAGTGRRFNYQALWPHDTVYIAGDFNGWQQVQMAVAPRVFSQFGISIPIATIKASNGQFKFVINGNLWVEPPDFATNVVAAGVGDPNSRNLVVVFD